MLSKINRFHGHNSLNYVYNRGITVRSPYCAMKAVKGKKDNFRIAVVVSKKVAKSAPHRNRIRRRVYEVIRILAPDIITNQDIVVSVFDERFLSLDHAELKESIKRQLKEIAEKT